MNVSLMLFNNKIYIIVAIGKHYNLMVKRWYGMVSKKTKVIVGIAAAAAAIAAAIYAAKKAHEKGYDKKAVKFLHDQAAKIKKEAIKLQKKPVKKKK
jgi:hypothetical protein